MKRKRLGLFSAVSCALLCGLSNAQDITVSQIGTSNDWAEYGQDGGIFAYSFATTSCNVGNQVVDWYDHLGRAPVIAQNMFRIADGRITQLGYSFLKYSFCAVSEPSCGSCQATPCDTLGIGCADTYGSGLNDGAFGGGAKWEINPTVGGPWPNNPTTSSGSLPLRGRLQVPVAEMAQPGSIYLGESQYVSQHDQQAGNARNNASWRYMNVTSLNNVGNGGAMNVGDPGIFAWQDNDPNVTINEVVYLNEGGSGVHGYMFLGYNVTQIDSTHWRYEYAIQNFNSDHGIGAFEIPLGCETAPTITDVLWRGVPKHSGSPYSNAAWNTTIANGVIRWEAPQTHAQNPNGNAIWWGTLYNFGFTADSPPAMAQASLVPFKPGGPAAHASTIEGPCGSPICGMTNYCSTAPNSFGSGATITGIGSTSVGLNNLKLQANGAVPGAFGLFYYGPNEIQTVFGDGFRCVGGQTHRLQGPIQINGSGSVTRGLNLTLPPADAGSGMIDAGSTWAFQFWFRDNPAGLSGFNLTDGLSVTFCP